MGYLEGKVALVTGAATGIGAACARALAREGATVACSSLPTDATQVVVDEIISAGGAARVYPLNVTDGEAAARVVEQVVAELGGIHVLVNNAGITDDQLLIRMRPESWRRVLAVNLDGAFNVTQPVAKVMMKQREGRVVSISSVVGLMGNAGQTNYAASKAGLVGFTKALAKELGSRGITVNAIAPGFIQTPMTDKLNEEQRKALLANLAIQRLGTPEDIANAVLFLVGPAGSYITGEVINVSGGLYM
ncbi:MAG: 3-oxoacyl-[acyl-carrier-protein] reductase [Thermoanaerobaculaceae bacterium]|nr:3-oxoacyl-[acyl-carrier-protein] reductase [Thermoanaerobaculaceae bacterium]MDI9620906.1 3-oxoacyl-[acyl-carrier-protein] reductase [Acidobacteriota bacterium]NLH10176.1 3-oxoacyl-[acyl-carrier-protein] reductase [Holophagae bacterium]HPW54774.1 3-oxoacyl-[acyl-carrier-protein] reductase [Thermoanaerobaculaceae bacterium]